MSLSVEDINDAWDSLTEEGQLQIDSNSGKVYAIWIFLESLEKDSKEVVRFLIFLIKEYPNLTFEEGEMEEDEGEDEGQVRPYIYIKLEQ